MRTQERPKLAFIGKVISNSKNIARRRGVQSTKAYNQLKHFSQAAVYQLVRTVV